MEGGLECYSLSRRTRASQIEHFGRPNILGADPNTWFFCVYDEWVGEPECIATERLNECGSRVGCRLFLGAKRAGPCEAPDVQSDLNMAVCMGEEI